MEIIEKILEVDEFWNKSGGYDIITDKQTIRLRIGTDVSCCESPGYFMSNDNFDDFVDAELHNIVVVDYALNDIVLGKIPSLDEGDVMFVNFETSNMTLQFVAYNAHNGYYGHIASVTSNQLKEEKAL